MEIPPAGPDGRTFDEEPEPRLVPLDQHPGLMLFRDTGDMAALQDATFNEWQWTVYRIRSQDEMVKNGSRFPRVFVTKSVGPFDIGALQQHFGGGVYEIRGVFEGYLRIRHREEIEGPRRQYDMPPARPAFSSYAPEPAPVPVRVSETDTTLAKLLENQTRLLERLLDRAAAPAPAAAPAAPPLGIAEVLHLADRLNQRELPNPIGDTMKQVLDVFKMGMDMRGQVEGGPETTTVERILEKAMPTLENIALGIFANRGARVVRTPQGGPAPASAAAPRPAGTSGLPEPPPVIHHEPSAAVVEPAEPAATTTDGSHRWPAAIEAMANSIEAGDDPLDFPLLLERLLGDDELAVLKQSPDDGIIAHVRANAGGVFPVLNTDDSATWMRTMLAELRNPTEDEV